MKKLYFHCSKMYLRAYNSYANWPDNGHDAALNAAPNTYTKYRTVRKLRQSNITNKEDNNSKETNIISRKKQVLCFSWFLLLQELLKVAKYFYIHRCTPSRARISTERGILAL